MIEVNSEIQGLQESIEHARLMLDAAELLGTASGELFISHLRDSDNGPKTIETALNVQEGFDNILAEAEALLDLLEAQLAVKEASDAVGGEHGNKAFFAQGE